MMIRTLFKTRSVYLLLAASFLSMTITEANADHNQNHCNQNLQIVEVSELSFGDYVANVGGGTITVDTNGNRTSIGPILAGGTVSQGVFNVYSTINGCDSYPVRIRYERNPNLTGPGANMPFGSYDPPRDTLITISPIANVPTVVNVGATLTSGSSQTQGGYTGTYRVRFQHRNP
jgi:hypothetical protein